MAMATRLLISLLVVFVLVGSSVAVTFSTKLIHRFSEEARDLRVLKNGEVSVSWPKRRNMDYYQLLVSNDFQRQRMKLGTRYQLLLTSEGSKTMSLGNDWGWLHYTWINIGTPNVSFLVALDTGSDLLWLPCNCIQCAPLSASYYNILDRDLSEYSPSGSSTSKHLSCSHEFCELGPNCKSQNDSCPYIVNYDSENTSSSGLLVEDILHLTSSSDHASKALVQAPVIIGCGKKQSGECLDGVAPDGLMGLGFGGISVPSFLAKAGLVRDSFSICFVEDGSGRIFFGDQGLATQQSTPFLPLDGKYIKYILGVESCCIGSSCLKKTGFLAEIDNGSSFTYLPDEVYEKIAAEFDRRVNATRLSYKDYPWEYCYEASSQDLLKIPAVTLMFAMNNSFVVQNPAFFVYGNQGVVGFCLAIQSTKGNLGTIGQNYMSGYRMVFDRENLKLGWSQSKCQDLNNGKRVPLTPSPRDRPENPLPTSEQQSTPSGKAVAPAVAGRAPSAASPPLVAAQHLTVRLLPLLFFRLCLFVSAI